MITGSGYKIQALQSLGYYLKNEQYQKSSATETLLSAFTNLNVTVGFPDSLESMKLPTLAIVENPTGPQETTYGGQRGIKTVPISFSVYGFAGGQQTDGANLYLRDEENIGKAEEIILLGIEVYPKNANINEILMNIYFEEGKIEEGLNIYIKIPEYTNDLNYSIPRATLEEVIKSRRYNRAEQIEFYNELLSYNPNDTIVRENTTFILLTLFMLQESVNFNIILLFNRLKRVA